MNNELLTRALIILEQMLEKKPTGHQELIAKAELVLGILQMPNSNPEFPSVLDEVVCRYESNVGVRTFDPDVLVTDPESDAWFLERRDEERPYFERYRKYLRQSGWDEEVIANLEVNCEKTLSRCADPHVSHASSDAKKRGMVMGDVQAGKTANYLGLINLACDYGYRVIVLLAGMTDSLRKQTQDRVDYGFIGAYSNSIGDMVDYIGVGEQPKQYYAIPLTNNDCDFNKFIQKNVNAAPKDYNKPVILVVKKNAKILESVHKWLKPGERYVSGDSILIIDDEADNASVNTSKPDYHPSRVNRRIRDIYNNFPIASYVGFTATPFANIFINPFDEDTYKDLFPADFIVQLNAPDNYFGGEKVFPEDGSIPTTIRVLDPGESDFVPVKHKKDLYVPALPDSLKEAILCFILNNVIRTLRGDKVKHRSMMINISPLNDPQESIRNAVDAYVNILKNIIEQDSYKPVQNFVQNADMLRMHKLYTEVDDRGTDFYAEIRKDYAWPDIQSGLWGEIKQFETTIINNRYKGDIRYDYNEHKEQGSRVIVIGGFVLSRGLTLEGLCVSYYSRSATAYDTLLQMCRWFGYRPRYEDLCRIYLSRTSIDNFCSVMDAIRDLKAQFREMELQGKAPSEFGLMVKQSPATLQTSLLITARNKMRHTQVFEHYVNYGGVYADTSKLFKDAEKNRSNLASVERFLEEQRAKGIPLSFMDNRYMARGISRGDIAHLLESIHIPSANKQFDCANISAYIRESQLYPIWDIVVATGKLKSPRYKTLQGQSFPVPVRSFTLGALDENYIRLGNANNRIVDPGIFDSGVEKKSEQSREIVSQKSKRLGKPVSSVTATDWLKLREYPLLAIYYIDLKIDDSLQLAERDRCVIAKEAFGADLLVGFAIGFPGHEMKESYIYRGNLVVTEPEPEEEFEEEELDDE